MTAPAVEVCDLTVKLGDHVALTELRFDLPAGSFLAVVGPNGAGKSTFFKVLLGLVEPTSGEARVLGAPAAELARGDAAYVPQMKTLDRTFPARAVDLVATGVLGHWPGFVRGALRARSEEALERVGARHLADRAISHLSGGELQRAYLARGLVRRPRIVMLDEPATGMDLTGEADMYRILEEYQNETEATVMMITHDWHAAMHHADHALLLNRRMIAFGPPEQALSDESMRGAFGHVGHAHAMRLMEHGHGD